MPRAGKKRKKQTGLSDCDPHPSKCITKKDSCSLQDEIVNHLQLLKECKALVVGFNAVLRGIKHDSLMVVLSIVRRSAQVMCHVLSTACKDRQILFLRLQDIDSLLSSSSVRSATTYGIKGSALLQEPKLSNLYERINGVLSSLKKSSGQKKVDGDPQTCSDAGKAESSADDDDAEVTHNDPSGFKNILHSKHGALSTRKSTECFISLDVYSEPEDEYFPDYATNWGNISISIQ